MYLTAENRRKYQNAPAVGTFADCAWGGIVLLAVQDRDDIVYWCHEYDGVRHGVKCSRLFEDDGGRVYFMTGAGRPSPRAATCIFLDDIMAVR